MDWFIVAAVGILAILAGFWVGRWSGQVSPVGMDGESEALSVGKPDLSEKAERDNAGNCPDQRNMNIGNESGRIRESGREHRGKRHPGREKKIPLGWPIGSPVSGKVSSFYEGSRRGALLVSDQGRVFAPASGKIIRLYPMGNRMLLRTDSGVELLIQVGGEPDELCGMYFRPRVVQNEVVGKGKLLMEYDRERLMAEGADTGVSISVEEADNLRDITITGKEHVKAGEELLWVREYEYLT